MSSLSPANHIFFHNIAHRLQIFKQNCPNLDFIDYHCIIQRFIVHTDHDYFRQLIQVGNVSAVCNVYIAELIPVYFIKSSFNLRMPFINNYSALIVTSNTFALQTPQCSTPVNISCLSCALKCLKKKKYGMPSGSQTLIKSIGTWMFKEAVITWCPPLIYIYIYLTTQARKKMKWLNYYYFLNNLTSYNWECASHCRAQRQMTDPIPRSLWSNFISQGTWKGKKN